MAKDYTWFKFKIPDWMMGRIQKQKPEVRGVFLNLTCKYWQKQCNLSIEDAKEAVDEVDYAYANLLSKGIISEKNGMVVVSFLDEQWAENQELFEKQSKGGKKAAAKLHSTKDGLSDLEGTHELVKDTHMVLNSDLQGTLCNKNEIEENEIEVIPNGIVGLDRPTPTVDAVSFSERCKKFIEKFNELRSTQFQATDKVKGSLKARLIKYSSAQIIQALKRAQKDEYHIKSNFKHLTPEYILRADILERFLNIQDDSADNQTTVKYVPPAPKRTSTQL